MEHLFSGDGMLANDGYTESRTSDMSEAPSAPLPRFEWSRSGVVRTLGATLSRISSAEVAASPAESVDEEACCAGTISRVSINSCWTFSSDREF